MRKTITAFLAALVLAAAAPAKGPRSDSIPKELHGRWAVAQRVYTPNDATNRVGDLLTGLGVRLEFKDGKLSALDPGKEGTYLLVSFDTAKTPPHIDLKVPAHEDQVMRGIYRLQDGILTICVGGGTDRPKAFDHPESDVELVMGKTRKSAPADPNSP